MVCKTFSFMSVASFDRFQFSGCEIPPPSRRQRSQLQAALGYPAQAGHGQPHDGAHAAYLPLFPLMDDDPLFRSVAPAVQLVHLRRRDGLSVQ